MHVKMLVPWPEVADAIRALPLADIGGVPHIDLRDLQELVALWMGHPSAVVSTVSTGLSTPAPVEGTDTFRITPEPLPARLADGPVIEAATVHPNPPAGREQCPLCDHMAHGTAPCLHVLENLDGEACGCQLDPPAPGALPPVPMPPDSAYAFTEGRLMRNAPPVA